MNSGNIFQTLICIPGMLSFLNNADVFFKITVAMSRKRRYQLVTYTPTIYHV